MNINNNYLSYIIPCESSTLPQFTKSDDKTRSEKFIKDNDYEYLKIIPSSNVQTHQTPNCVQHIISSPNDNSFQNSTQRAVAKRKKFSSEEDNQLKKLIDLYGAKKWDKIASLMPGRTGRQCRDRFTNYLESSLTNGPWTDNEDELLEKKVCEFGLHWNLIVKFFKGRSTNNIKNRWYTYVCKQNKFTKNIISKNKNFQKINNNFIDDRFTDLPSDINNKEFVDLKNNIEKKMIFPPISPPDNIFNFNYEQWIVSFINH